MANNGGVVLSIDLPINEVRLRRGKRGLGFNIGGGTDMPHINGEYGIYVTKVRRDGAAYKDGRIRPGDRIVSINEISLEEVTHNTAVRAFINAPEMILLKVQHGAKNYVLGQGMTGDLANKELRNVRNNNPSTSKTLSTVMAANSQKSDESIVVAAIMIDLEKLMTDQFDSVIAEPPIANRNLPIEASKSRDSSTSQYSTVGTSCNRDAPASTTTVRRIPGVTKQSLFNLTTSLHDIVRPMVREMLTADVNNRFSTTDDRLKKYRNNIMQLMTNFRNNTNSLHELRENTKKQLLSLRNKISQQKKEIRGLKVQISGLASQLADLDACMTAAGVEPQVAVTHAANTEPYVAVLAPQVAGLDSQVSGLEEHVAGLEQQVTGLQQHAGDLEPLVVGHERQVSHRTSKCADCGEISKCSECTGWIGKCHKNKPIKNENNAVGGVEYHNTAIDALVGTAFPELDVSEDSCTKCVSCGEKSRCPTCGMWVGSCQMHDNVDNVRDHEKHNGAASVDRKVIYKVQEIITNEEIGTFCDAILKYAVENCSRSKLPPTQKNNSNNNHTTTSMRNNSQKSEELMQSKYHTGWTQMSNYTVSDDGTIFNILECDGSLHYRLHRNSPLMKDNRTNIERYSMASPRVIPRASARSNGFSYGSFIFFIAGASIVGFLLYKYQPWTRIRNCVNNNT